MRSRRWTGLRQQQHSQFQHDFRVAGACTITHAGTCALAGGGIISKYKRHIHMHIWHANGYTHTYTYTHNHTSTHPHIHAHTRVSVLLSARKGWHPFPLEPIRQVCM